MKTSGEMLNHAIQDNPSDVTYTEGSRVVTQIKNDSTFQTSGNTAISNATNGKVHHDEWLNFETTTDLHGSLHGVHLVIDGSMDNNGCVDLNVTVTDRYDFDFTMDYFKKDIIKGIIFATGNNLAWSDQFLGVVQNYDVTITFDHCICP